MGINKYFFFDHFVLNVNLSNVDLGARAGRAQADGLQGDGRAHGDVRLHVVLQARQVVAHQEPPPRALLTYFSISTRFV